MYQAIYLIKLMSLDADYRLLLRTHTYLQAGRGWIPKEIRPGDTHHQLIHLN